MSSGRYQVLYSGKLDVGFMVVCDFSDVSANKGSEWPSSVGIVLSTEEHGTAEAQGDSLLKIVASQTESAKGWQYHLSIREAGEIETKSSAVAEESAQPIGFTFALVRENVALYTLGDDVSNTSAIDLSRLDLVHWTVLASGAAGSAVCAFDFG